MWRICLFAGMLWAGDAAVPGSERPSCHAGIQGRMWPDEANRDAKVARQLARDGKLSICNHGPWRYHWAEPSVHVRQLMERAQKRKPGGTGERAPRS